LVQCKGKIKQIGENGEQYEQLCLNSHFYKRGTDSHHKSLPQILECKACGTRCYSHTSYEFEVKAKDIVKQFLIATFEEHQPLLGQGERYYFSLSSLSQTGQKFKTYIDDICKDHNQKVAGIDLFTIPRPDFSFHQQLGYLDVSGSVPKFLDQSSSEQLIPFSSDKNGSIIVDSPFATVLKGITGSTKLDFSKIIIMDETFLKIGGIDYCLIIAVSKEGKLLSWTLSRTRKTQDLDGVFQEALLRYPFPGVVVTDHFAGYHAMIKRYPYPIIHISHIHKPPYNRAVIYQRFFFKEENKILELQLAINTDIVASSKQQLVQYMLEETPLIPRQTGPRGRPTGSKNRPKEIVQKEIEEKQAKTKKRRGRKNPFRSNSFASLTVDLDHNSLQVEDVTDKFLSDRMYFLFMTLLLLFHGNYLTSNYVENIFSQLKLNLRRGLKADPTKFLQTMFLFTIENHDRINETTVLEELIDKYIVEFSPPPSFGYRPFFKGAMIPSMFSFNV
jgi:hypothetical protein